MGKKKPGDSLNDRIVVGNHDNRLFHLVHHITGGGTLLIINFPRHFFYEVGHFLFHVPPLQREMQ